MVGSCVLVVRRDDVTRNFMVMMILLSWFLVDDRCGYVAATVRWGYWLYAGTTLGCWLLYAGLLAALRWGLLRATAGWKWPGRLLVLLVCCAGVLSDRRCWIRSPVGLYVRRTTKRREQEKLQEN